MESKGLKNKVYISTFGWAMNVLDILTLLGPKVMGYETRVFHEGRSDK